MKLLKLTIKNFRGLKGNHNVIDFEKSNIIFLIGQNNIGKSTFLQAYEFFVSPKQIAAKEDFYDYETNVPIEMEGLFLKEDNDDNQADFVGTGRVQEPDWIEKWVDANGHVRIRKIWRSVGADFSKFTYSPQQGEWVANGFGGFASLLKKYAPQPILINAMEDEKSLEEKVNKLMQDKYLKSIKETSPDIYERAVNAIKSLQDAITSSEDVREMNASLDAHFANVFSGLHLKIEASKDENIKVEDAFKKNHTVRVEHEGSERQESFLQNGHGVIRQALFNFIAFLNGNHEGTRKEHLILYEEPELFLHPKLTFKLRAALYELAENSPYQILCATHSPMMIDISKPHTSLVRVTKDGEDNIRTYQADETIFAADDEQKEMVQMVNRMNPHICEVFYADKVILVEGDTEAIVYRELLSKFYPDSEVFVLNTGSKMNIPFFQKILTHFRIEHYAIHDTDTKLLANGHRNPAWSLNEKIWALVEEANNIQPGLAGRYVHNAYFENAHKYRYDNEKGKPLSAYKFAASISRETNPKPVCLKWLDDIMGERSIVHDAAYVEANAKTLAMITEENNSFEII